MAHVCVASLASKLKVQLYELTQIFHAKEDPWGEVKWFIIDFQALFAIPIIVFGFNCHANVVTVFKCTSQQCTPPLPSPLSCGACKIHLVVIVSVSVNIPSAPLIMARVMKTYGLGRSMLHEPINP